MDSSILDPAPAVAPAPTLPEARAPRAPWIALGLGVGVAAGFAAGYYAGAERIREDLRHPFKPAPVVSATPSATPSGKAPSPSPKPGALVMAPLPLAASRRLLAKQTTDDKVVVVVAAVGRGDAGPELHLSVKNRGDCVVTAVEGVAYGFDPDGDSTAMNLGGKHYLAFSHAELALKPGAGTVLSSPAPHAEIANMALAQIDRVVCQDGRTFQR
ncbi:MAG: hypothetical protein IT374_05240 [Polyangiaceae bacterium]|nr:hypothetical protein [Polyangiaceae bacterium]